MNNVEIFALKLIPGLGNKSLLNLFNADLSFAMLLQLPAEDLYQYIKGSRAKEAVQALKTESDYFLGKAAEAIRDIEAQKISIIGLGDEMYPPLFRLLKDRPLFIYARGNLDLLNHEKSLAIVGTRECTATGGKIAKQMANKFATMGVNIVSGLASGIDTFAHEGALDAGGATTAVLVDAQNVYPKENKRLAERILDSGGLLLAENEPGVKMLGALFAIRDRLQSALSQGIIPIETDVKGGTMHTVRYALEQNRDLYCPDIRRVTFYRRDQREVRGIWELIESEKARPIVETDYSQIVEVDIPAKRKELFAKLEDEKVQQEIFR